MKFKKKNFHKKTRNLLIGKKSFFPERLGELEYPYILAPEVLT